MTLKPKFCPDCERILGVSKFSKRNYKRKDGSTRVSLDWICKECAAKRNKDWRSSESGKAREKARVRDKEYLWANKLLRKYGLTPEEYYAILEEQRGVCAICGRSPDSFPAKRKLAVDHNHKTGKRRGLLCGPCNSGVIGSYDDPELYRKAADYLEKYQ